MDRRVARPVALALRAGDALRRVAREPADDAGIALGDRALAAALLLEPGPGVGVDVEAGLVEGVAHHDGVLVVCAAGRAGAALDVVVGHPAEDSDLGARRQGQDAGVLEEDGALGLDVDAGLVALIEAVVRIVRGGVGGRAAGVGGDGRGRCRKVRGARGESRRGGDAGSLDELSTCDVSHSNLPCLAGFCSERVKRTRSRRPGAPPPLLPRRSLPSSSACLPRAGSVADDSVSDLVFCLNAPGTSGTGGVQAGEEGGTFGRLEGTNGARSLTTRRPRLGRLPSIRTYRPRHRSCVRGTGKKDARERMLSFPGAHRHARIAWLRRPSGRCSGRARGSGP